MHSAINRINNLEFIASGTSFTVGQDFTPDAAWPSVPVKTYDALINFETHTIHLELVREMGERMPPGGGVPFTGEVRQIQVVRGDEAWNAPGTGPKSEGAAPATPCTLPEAGGTGWQRPAPESQVLCMLAIWTTPQGFIKAAMAKHAVTKKVSSGTEVSFTIDGKYPIKGIINAQHQVQAVRSWVGQSLVGDMLVETEYTGYRAFGGVLFPTHIVQKQDGFPSLDLNVLSVIANPAVDITAPTNIRSTPPKQIVKSQRVADGVYWLTGGTHHSLAIEMNDHIVLVDTPNGEDRALSVIAESKRLIPGKPIRYVVAMHHHWDHLGGIRTAIDEGSTIVTHESNKEFIERIARAPHKINPDLLAMSNRPLRLQTAGDEATLTDGKRIIKLYVMTGFEHTADLLLVYLPNERILAEADAYTPAASPKTPLIAAKASYAASLCDNIQHLHLDVQTIVPFHGNRIVNVAEVAKQAGR
jgi:glyoxylase-like metal-dependent hydrolase (beta-lactamase superfamily II)